MIPIQIPSVVEEELLIAATYYDSQRDGLGDAFTAAVKQELIRISIFPESYPRFPPHARICFLRRFPYGLIYRRHGEYILVLALVHQREAPQSHKKKASREE